MEANVYIDSYYRPDSLLSHVSKLLEKIVFKNMFNHLHVNSLLYKFPSGFMTDSNITSFKRFESKPVVKIILLYDRLSLWRHRQFITIFYPFLHIRIEIIHGSHMHILFLPRVGLYVSFLPLANARGKTSWHKGLPVVKAIYTYGFHELFLKYSTTHQLYYITKFL